MAFAYQNTFKRSGHFYRDVRKFAQRREVLLSVNVMLTLFTISFFAIFAIRPTAITIARLWREIQDKKSVSEKLSKKIASLELAQQNLAVIEGDLALLDEALPPSVSFPRFVRIVEYLASSRGVQLASAQFPQIDVYTSPEVASGSAVQLVAHPISLSLRGAYGDLLGFLSDLERLDRLISFRSVSMAPVKQTEVPTETGVFLLSLQIEGDYYSFPKGGESR